MTNVIQLIRKDGEPRVDTRELATHLGLQHQNVFEMVKDYRTDFEALGLLRFETGKPRGAKGGRPERYAALNEDQCYLLLTFSRNTARVRALKVSLVKAFGDCRRNGAATALTYWQQLQQVDAEDRESRALATAGAQALNARKRAIPGLRQRRLALESKVMPDLFLVAA